MLAEGRYRVRIGQQFLGSIFFNGYFLRWYYRWFKQGQKILIGLRFIHGPVPEDRVHEVVPTEGSP